MAQKVKCNECGHEFESYESGQITCEACGSTDVAVKSGGSFFQERKRLLLIAGVVLTLIILVILGKTCPSICDESSIVIKEVDVKVDSTCVRPSSIKIKAVAESNCKLRYTIDHGKTTNQGSPNFYKLNNGRYDVYVKIDGDDTNWIPWSGNPIIINPPCPECEILEILECDTISPSCDSLGTIIIHAITDCPPITYILNDSLIQQDSIFRNVEAGAYIVSIQDSTNNYSISFQDTIFMPPQPTRDECEDSIDVPCNEPPDKDVLQAKINELFTTSRGDQTLQDEILEQFKSRRITVTGKLLNTTANYTIYQYLFRQNIGLPGAIRVRVKSINHNNNCKITSIEVEEIGKQ